ncbi:ABC transporter ATP-binding protein [Okeania sp. SIO2B3]|uniref:ABC transporter ATP-binding protein n=1 Tax=Okeania sp. SIO2B3 TaxID=2607784 RepID=UPI0013C07846|nr:ABC transporter ATP-binding protein [Okeania sp. SIO2B3]NET41993.1 ABC transporter ATP-binding protein [Okeania sp. SIO2B3]
MAQSVILCLESLSKQFSRTAIPAVQNVNLTLYQGDILGLLGPSGCGKTTLLRMIAGFEQPQSGIITINEQVVAGVNDWVAPEKRDVGMVFQDYALFPHLTVAKNIAFGLHNSGKKSSRQINHQVADALELVGLSGLESRYPHELSGGQQQRIALARALAPNPALVLLDEPLSNLDVQVRIRLRQELRDILKNAGASGIFVTHDQEEAMAISDRVAVMRAGCVEQFGTPEDIYTEPASQFVAEFVTQANFLPARRQGQLWETELGDFELTDNHLFGGKIGSLDEFDQVELMIRQENLMLKPDDGGSVVIHDRQFLGREFRYSLRTESGQELIARTTPQLALPMGIKVKVSIAEDCLRVFPATSTKNLAQSSSLVSVN